MPLDGAMLHTVLHELQDALADGRIDKVLQPERDELHLLIRAGGENIRLLASASPANPRIHITQANKPNPTPPAFCMLLRKHLTGGRITAVTQPGTDRIIRLHIQSRDELGDWTEKQLIVEIMGRYSNILLVQDGTILDCIKHIGSDVNRYREILPGRPYVSPPGQGKRDPFALDGPASALVPHEGDLTRSLYTSFFGLSPASAGEIAFRALGTDRADASSLTDDQWKALDAAFAAYLHALHTPAPMLILDSQGTPKDLLPFPYKTYEGAPYVSVASPSACVEEFYQNTDKANRMAQRTAHLTKTVKTALERSEKKLANQRQDFNKAEDGDKYRLYGELLTANMYALTEGQASVTVSNYYDEAGGTVTIPMDKSRTVNQNAQSYFKRYAKTRSALTQLAQQIPATEAEIAYLEGQLVNLSQCETDAEVNEIGMELMDEGYLRRVKKQQKQIAAPSKPLHYVSGDGYDIYVGKNNRQNDWLTFKKANATDLWLHAKDTPGSHVIIRTQGQPLEEIPDGTLTEAAQLAAWYSKGRTGSHIPVDYCPRSHVKKPGTYKPGLVIYEGYFTVYIDPRKESVEAIRKGD